MISELMILMRRFILNQKHTAQPVYSNCIPNKWQWLLWTAYF